MARKKKIVEEIKEQPIEEEVIASEPKVPSNIKKYRVYFPDGSRKDFKTVQEASKGCGINYNVLKNMLYKKKEFIGYKIRELKG